MACQLNSCSFGHFRRKHSSSNSSSSRWRKRSRSHRPHQGLRRGSVSAELQQCGPAAAAGAFPSARLAGARPILAPHQAAEAFPSAGARPVLALLRAAGAFLSARLAEVRPTLVLEPAADRRSDYRSSRQLTAPYLAASRSKCGSFSALLSMQHHRPISLFWQSPGASALSSSALLLSCSKAQGQSLFVGS